MKLKDYLRQLGSDVEREAFASACGSTLNYLKLIAYNASGKGKRASASLAVRIDRASGGQVQCEELRPDVDWAYLRSTSHPS